MINYLPGSPDTGSWEGSVCWLISDPTDSIMFKSIVPSSSNGITWHGGGKLAKSFGSSWPNTGTISWKYHIMYDFLLITLEISQLNSNGILNEIENHVLPWPQELPTKRRGILWLVDGPYSHLNEKSSIVMS